MQSLTMTASSPEQDYAYTVQYILEFNLLKHCSKYLILMHILRQTMFPLVFIKKTINDGT